MKKLRFDHLITALVVCFGMFHNLILWADPITYTYEPEWWHTSNNLIAKDSLGNRKPSENFGLANQGQFKNFVAAAVAELNVGLPPNGAGVELNQLVNSWNQNNANANNHAPVNLGQAKAVSKLVYDRLIAEHQATKYPWEDSVNPPDNYAPLNIGQLKNLFAIYLDVDNDGIEDSYERMLINLSSTDAYNTLADISPTGDFDNNGINNLSQYMLIGKQAIPGSTATIPELTELPPHTPVGALKGNFSVGGDGSATYSIPIDIPKGTGGMEPQLALGYSSNGGNGICGLGFSLSGLQSITRGPTSLRKDGFIDGVDFDDNDRFFLNGERLICTEGGYGLNGSVYHTEMESYSRVVLHGNANDAFSYWTVQTKAGLTLEFGNGVNARIKPTGQAASLAWAVNKVSDTKGNYYTLSYTTEDSVDTMEVANHRIDHIDYTGNVSAGLAPYCSINFVYESRVDTSFAYTYGVKTSSSMRLKEISVRTGGYENHKYTLTYKKSLQTNRSLLSQVQKSAAGLSIPSTKIDWDAYVDNNLPASMWTPHGDNQQFSSYGTGQDGDNNNTSYVDVEDAGNTAHLLGNTWRSINLPNNFTVGSSAQLQFEFKRSNIPSELCMIGLDEDSSLSFDRLYYIYGSTANSDLDSDVKKNSRINPLADTWVTVTLPIGQDHAGKTMSRLSLINDDDTKANGLGECWYKNVRILNPTDNNSNTIWITYQDNFKIPRFIYNQKDRGYRFVDLNCDGLLDITRNEIYSEDETVFKTVKETYINQGNSFQPDTYWHSPAVLSFNNGNNDSDHSDEKLANSGFSSSFSDYNGDGRPDIVKKEYVGANRRIKYTTMIHNGNGWVEDITKSLPFQSEHSGGNILYDGRFHHFMEMDVNGDGYIDQMLYTHAGKVGVWGGSNYTTTYLENQQRCTFLNEINNVLEPKWKHTTAFSLPYPGSIKDFMSKRDEGRGLADLNGDGLPDFYTARMTYDHKTYFNDGNKWDNVSGNWDNATGNIAARFPANVPFCHAIEDHRTGSRLLDLNGDGLPDILRCYGYNTGSAASTYGYYENTRYCYMNNGKTNGTVESSMFTQVVNFISDMWTPFDVHCDSSYSVNVRDHGFETADLNGDGLVDLIFSNDKVNRSFINTGSGFLNSDFNATASSYVFPNDAKIYSTYDQLLDSNRVARLVDINGDGFSDLLCQINTSSPKVYINQSKPEKVIKITDGFDSDIQITYQRLNDASICPYTGGKVYDFDKTAALAPGVMDIIDSRYVVSYYSAPDYLTANGRRITAHRYGNLRYDRENESSMGFIWAEVIDVTTGQLTHTTYSQKFPYYGSPSYTYTQISVSNDQLTNASSLSGSDDVYPNLTVGWRVLSEEGFNYGELPRVDGIGNIVPDPSNPGHTKLLRGGTIYRPLQTRSHKIQRDLENVQYGSVKSSVKTDNGEDAFETNGDLKAQFKSGNQPNSDCPWDQYGFLKLSVVTDDKDGSTVTTSNQYDHFTDQGRWHLGRLAASSVSKKRTGEPDINKASSFTYYSDSGMLKTEQIEPNNQNTIQKEYFYDAFGNIRRTEVTGSAQTRFSVSEYDTRGRFVTKELNQLEQSVIYDYDQQKARLNFTTDINGLTTHFEYDPFGTQILTLHPDGTKTGEVTGFATNADVSLVQNVTNTIKYFRAKQTSGAPASFVYLDGAGREIVTKTKMLSLASPDPTQQSTGSTQRYENVYSHTCYDSRGRKTAVSDPIRSDSGTQKYTTIDYDFLDRALKTTHPNGSIDQVDCYKADILDGMPVTYSCVTANRSINELKHTLQRWEDRNGRLIQSQDNSGLVTKFHYDMEGRMTRVTVGDKLLLENKFDTFGNKKEVWEANSGTSTSIFNAFGEVTSSTNARGDITTYTYDLLGRPKIITKPEGTYENFYDTAGGTAAKGKPARIVGSGAAAGYLEKVSYDSLGRVVLTTKTQFGETFHTYTVYDVLSRVHASIDAGGLITLNEYDPNYSILTKVSLLQENGSQLELWKAGSFDAKGNPTRQSLANGVTINKFYEPGSGSLSTLSSTIGTEIVQKKTYSWDLNGNLKQRKNLVNTNNVLIEDFGYDSLNRLTSRTIGTTTEQYKYDANGNLKAKPGMVEADTTYSPTKYHQITATTLKGAARTFTYDDGGYITHDGKRNYVWTSFGQLKALFYPSAPALQALDGTEIYSPANVAEEFDFDAGGNRARQIKTRTPLITGDTITEATLYLGSYEREIHKTGANITKTLHRHNLGSIIYTRSIDAAGTQTTKLTTLLTDHLGSTDVLITGNIVNYAINTTSTEYQAFDPWGERASPATAVSYRSSHTDAYHTSSRDYDRGYTGHEMLDDSGLIHMNGRLYDPELGRMLSADPFVQVPEYSQNFNRYSYVMNNPLNMTDPTGYSWVSKAFHRLGSWLKENWRSVVSIALGAILMFTPGGQAFMAGIVGGMLGGAATATAIAGTAITWGGIATGAITGGIMGATNAALAGGGIEDILRGAIVGAVQGAISSGPLHAIEGVKGLAAVHVVGHGIVGGAANVAMGGKFQDGFLSAAAGAAAGHIGLFEGIKGSGVGAVAGRTAVAAVIGGTASALGGGKFANGAYTAAFQHLLNYEFANVYHGLHLTDSENPSYGYNVEGVMWGTRPTGAAYSIKDDLTVFTYETYHYGNDPGIQDATFDLMAVYDLGRLAISGLRALAGLRASTVDNVTNFEFKTNPRSVTNMHVNITKEKFANNLLKNGFTPRPVKNGEILLLEKNGVRYALRDNASSTGKPTADYYKAGSKSIDLKIRLEWKP